MIVRDSRNKLYNYYLLYYILILLKSIFIILIFRIKFNFIYFLKNYFILIIYLKLYYIIYEFNSFVYKNNYNFNYIFFYIYKYNKINFKNKNNICNKINIIEKIIEIKKISYTIKKGRIKRYKILTLIGNKQGWIGIGIGKNSNINKAIILSKINALNNIYYFKYSILNVYKLKYIYINSSKFFVKLQFKIYSYINVRFLLLKYLLECLGYLNCKIIIYHNIIHNKYNLLNKILLMLFNIF
ncbi:apicoplast ribosomal protein S5, putative [Plasmodium knowlesi strain H]|uniref:Apicoplast ribosomal protein S5, putative n=2 Tax=Plasmodium knowlesi (strain H) TaxID=5851 RepID=A0A5E7XAJ7_PLAKH|nr:ribosomal protein S5 [Plasmodium knowlesi strain H]CAA9991341.1 apicoplast ribosomal protein S5, putative [Plasmodium knowlesi strain H]SBO27211.1 apicoplast ribosomal protein S5, putative [Plasmodium knowlesi strain H]VVS80815.1 apicoplast ribosomal protein S5, putative [Plasmodium knowlesi strain H]